MSWTNYLARGAGRETLSRRVLEARPAAPRMATRICRRYARSPDMQHRDDEGELFSSRLGVASGPLRARAIGSPARLRCRPCSAYLTSPYGALANVILVERVEVRMDERVLANEPLPRVV